jgi:hypothetical protein
MPTTQTVNSVFKGALAGDVFKQAFKKADTIEKGAITVIPNVLGSGFLPKITYSGTLQAMSCGFNPTGTVQYDEKEVATKRFKLEEEICKEKFAATFAAQAAGLVSAKAEIPSTIQEAILMTMIDSLAQTVDLNIWQGNNSANQMNGLLPQFVADADVIDGTIVAATKANVVAQIEVAYGLVPDSIINDPDLIFAVSNNVGKAYRQAQASMGLNTTVGVKELDYLGYPMVELGGLPNNTILAYRVKNLGFLTGLQNEWNEVNVKDMDESDLSGNIRTQVKFTAGVGYSFGSEVVYCRV